MVNVRFIEKTFLKNIYFFINKHLFSIQQNKDKQKGKNYVITGNDKYPKWRSTHTIYITAPLHSVNIPVDRLRQPSKPTPNDCSSLGLHTFFSNLPKARQKGDPMSGNGRRFITASERKWRPNSVVCFRMCHVKAGPIHRLHSLLSGCLYNIRLLFLRYCRKLDILSPESGTMYVRIPRLGPRQRPCTCTWFMRRYFLPQRRTLAEKKYPPNPKENIERHGPLRLGSLTGCF